MIQTVKALDPVSADFAQRTKAENTKSLPHMSPGPISEQNPNHELFLLVQKLFLSSSDSPIRQVVVCGVDRENESSEISLGLAKILANHSGRSVCVLNAKGDKQTGVPNVRQTVLLSNMYCTEVAPELWLCDLSTSELRTHDELLSSEKVKETLTHLAGRFDFLIIDTPGANISGDAAIFGRSTDGALLVIAANSTRRAAARKAAETLAGMDCRILGSVLTNRTFSVPEFVYRFF